MAVYYIALYIEQANASLTGMRARTVEHPMAPWFVGLMRARPERLETSFGVMVRAFSSIVLSHA